MVIHDCRNPTNHIKFAIDMALTAFKDVEKKTMELEGMLLEMTNSVFIDLKQVLTELIEENKDLQTRLAELQAFINDNPMFNQKTQLLKRI